MGELLDEKLNQLLKEAYPAIEVSPDFTLRLWRRLMKTPRPYWMIPVPVAALAAFAGILFGIQTWFQVLRPQALVGEAASALGEPVRWDLFGNAPSDTLAGSVLSLMRGEKA